MIQIVLAGIVSLCLGIWVGIFIISLWALARVKRVRNSAAKYKLMAYVDLLHLMGGVDNDAVRDFLASHHDDEVFQRRARIINRLVLQLETKDDS